MWTRIPSKFSWPEDLSPLICSIIADVKNGHIDCFWKKPEIGMYFFLIFHSLIFGDPVCPTGPILATILDHWNISSYGCTHLYTSQISTDPDCWFAGGLLQYYCIYDSLMVFLLGHATPFNWWILVRWLRTNHDNNPLALEMKAKKYLGV